MASPTIVELPLKIATRAQHAAAGLQTIARVIAPGMGNGETRVIRRAGAARLRRAGLAMTDAQAASITAVPLGPPRELEVATWARRIAAGPRALAFTVSLDATDEEVRAIAEITTAVRVLLAGGGP